MTRIYMYSSRWVIASVIAFVILAAQPGRGNDQADFSMSVMDAFKITGKGVILTGIIKSGSVRVGDSVCLKTAKIGQRSLSVKAIEMKRAVVNEARAGDMPGILVDGIDRKDISKDGTSKLTSSCSD